MHPPMRRPGLVRNCALGRDDDVERDCAYERRRAQRALQLLLPRRGLPLLLLPLQVLLPGVSAAVEAPGVGAE